MKKGSRRQSFRHNPFKLQKDRLPSKKELEAELPSTKKKQKASRATAQPQDDESIFARAMADVTPLHQTEKHHSPKTPHAPMRDDDLEALQELDDLVHGKQYFDIVYSDEYVEGAIQGLDPRILQRLRNGEYAWQAYLDMHGMRVDEAKESLVEFIQTQRTKGRRCLLIIHGRGHHSPNQQPILKQRLLRWLSRGFLHKQILAFTSARPHDGGLGALYLLLRRHPNA